MKTWFTFLLGFMTISVFAQDECPMTYDVYNDVYVYNCSYDEDTVFYSLESALEDPLKVKLLYLSDSGLSQISYRIGELKNLEVLLLNKNELSEIPYQVFELEKLRYLILSNNLLTELDYRIGQLENLQILNIRNNTKRNCILVQNKLEYFFLYQGKKHSHSCSYDEYF